jgi:putative tricarboxylic transport membrane protein
VNILKNINKYIIAAGLSILFAFVLFMNTFKLPEDAAKLPKILMGLIVLLSIGTVLEAYKKDKKAKESGDKEEPEKINHVRALIFGAMVAVYVLTMEPIGYFIMTPIYVMAAYLFLKATKVRNMIFISVGFTVFVYFVFVVFLKLPVPMGILQ